MSYSRATQMADRGPNPDLWTVKAGPHQALKKVFYLKKFLSQNIAFFAMLLRYKLLISSITVDQADV